MLRDNLNVLKVWKPKFKGDASDLAHTSVGSHDDDSDDEFDDDYFDRL